MSGVTELNLNKYLVQTSTMHGNYIRMAKKHNHENLKHDSKQKETNHQIKQARDKKYNVKEDHDDR